METKIIKDKDVSFITVKNDKNLEVTLCSFGASFYRIVFKGKNRIMTPINHEEFYNNEQYYGKLIGRFSGRIKDAKCEIKGISYDLPKNWNGINSLHGGPKGVSFSNFDYEIKEEMESIDVIFTFIEKESYLPGDVNYKITYHIFKNKDKILLDMEANTTKETIVNITNHAYWSLSSGKRLVLDEILTLGCKYHGDLDMNLIAKSIVTAGPTMDFTKGHEIGKYINDSYLQNHTSFGYDHFFVKTNEDDTFAAKLEDKEENVTLTTNTSYPAIVVYTDNYPTKMEYENCKVENKYQAIALECQYIPNGINMDDVNKAILKPNEQYKEFISYELE
jgi:aldose 1-epimerase